MNPNTLFFYPDFQRWNKYQENLYYGLSECGWQVIPGIPEPGDGCASERRVFHLHWEQVIYRGSKTQQEAATKVSNFIRHMNRCKEVGWKVFWTIHNQEPHENLYPNVYSEFSSALFSLADLILLHSNSHEFIVPLEFKHKIRVIPHGNYSASGEISTHGLSLKKQLHIRPDEPLFLFFGQIRTYKGLDDLITALGLVEPAINLLIAGEGSVHIHQQDLSKLPHNIRLLNRRVSDEEVPLLLKNSDFMILPYKKILNSGTLLLSLTYGLPAIIPNHKTLQQFTGQDTGTITYEAGSRQSLADAINFARALKPWEKDIYKQAALLTAAKFDWHFLRPTFEALLLEQVSGSKAEIS